MNAQEMWSLAGAIITSVGGAGLILCGFVGFFTDRIAKHLDLKYEQRLNLELEKYKSNLEQYRYVTKAQFDKEFEIYHELSEAFFSMVVKFSSITKREFESKTVSQFHEEITIDEIKNVIKTTSAAQNLLYANGAFIPEELFEMYHLIMENANTLFWRIGESAEDCALRGCEIKNIVTNEDRELEMLIETQFNEVNSKLREYLRTLMVID